MRPTVSLAILVLTSMPALAQSPPSRPLAKAGSLQTGRKSETPASRAVMEPGASVPVESVDGRVLRMPTEQREIENALSAVGAIAERQPPLAQAAGPASEGEQKGRVPETVATAPGTYVHLVLKLVKGDGATVVSATELPGTPPVVDTPEGDFVLAVASGLRTVAVRSLSDPFQAHSFGGDKPDEFRPHHFETQPSAFVTMDVPRGALQQESIGSLSLELLRIRPGPPVSKVDPATVERLQRENRLEPQIERSHAIIGPDLERRLMH